MARIVKEDLAVARYELPDDEALAVFGSGEAGRSPSGLPTGLDSLAMHELRVLAAETGAGCCSAVEPHVVHGNPFIEILAEASERSASLIVLGATERSAFENLTRDRTIYRVLAHARCPVLTLREAQSEPTPVEAWRLAMHG